MPASLRTDATYRLRELCLLLLLLPLPCAKSTIPIGSSGTFRYPERATGPTVMWTSSLRNGGSSPTAVVCRPVGSVRVVATRRSTTSSSLVWEKSA